MGNRRKIYTLKFIIVIIILLLALSVELLVKRCGRRRLILVVKQATVECDIARLEVHKGTGP